MALDPQEYKQRRARREQERLARAKKTKIKLILAALVLVATGVLLLFMGGKNPIAQPESTQQSTPPAITNEAATLPAETDGEELPPETTGNSKVKPDTVIRLAAAGDLNINEAVVQAGGLNYDYTNLFMDIAHLLGDADITAVNFEGVMTGPPYGSNGSAPSALLEALSDAGVDLLQMANSYSIHHGMSGLSSTLSAVRAAGLEPLGAYASNEEFRSSKGYTIRVVNGVKLAFVAFTKGMNGMALPAGSESCVNVLYTDYATTYQQVDSEKILSILNAAKKESPDLIIAMLHWGSEFNDTISNSQKAILELLQENGVGVVLGTHSHYVQQMLYDQEAGTFATYSLGDFLSDTQRGGTEYSVILELEITKNGQTGETKVTNYQYTPIFNTYSQEEPMRLVRIREAMFAYEEGYLGAVSDELYGDMQYALGRVEKRVNGG